MRRLIHDGFSIGGQHFVVSERSASMVRTGILSFIDDTIAEEIDRRITMGITIDKTSISKYSAYRGLCLSSCHCIEGWLPNIVVVKDCFLTIPRQHIKYVYDRKIRFTDQQGRDREWTQKDIAEKEQDIEINAFDGCGIAHPKVMEELAARIGTDEKITSFIMRGCYLKGCVSMMDYESFFEERGVRYITDIWGVQHDVTRGSEPMIIILESMYKGLKYFNRTGTIEDWEEYWYQFKKNEHCIGVAKWNFTAENEPIYTRVNYQILQDLDLPYEKFRHLADKSTEWYEKILSGDEVYTYCFLGMMADRHKPLNNYCEAALKNPEMLKEDGVRTYIANLLTKYRDEFKCGKLWLKATFKFLVPDPIMMMEHIGGLPLKGCLEADEFYSFDRNGVFDGERLIERNPHICKSEHVILRAVNNELLQKYCGHLVNTCIVNTKSITPQRLNGADYDGDLVCVIDEPLMMEGVDRNAAITMDVEDKITALSEPWDMEHRTECILRGLRSQIGEISNMASAYHNKCPKTDEARKRYENYTCLLSTINGRLLCRCKTA